ncbi:Uu.00g081190.m01.CDS01 [Anthostomella pinea]|uniref:Uu.00g081190.m01.CDS01 n=1 Tax=Anthostomella pinea TaxID=933095 RepID=A0AAI8YJI5_9PEZI|nr:Uu.00g081190.m01.CDS01 [Anthostomella pinea]
MSSLPTQIAETVQTAHINRAPSPHHDMNPSTAASEKQPVDLHPLPRGRSDNHQSHSQHSSSASDISIDEDHDRYYDNDDDDIPISVLEPRAPRRNQSFPPMPDLRFEQSYLHSIAKADTWWKVGWITVRDQMMMPLVQGVLYNLAICGWQHWNKNAQLSGNTAGARIRRWWYGVNNWPLPKHAKAS